MLKLNVPKILASTIVATKYLVLFKAPSIPRTQPLESKTESTRFRISVIRGQIVKGSTSLKTWL